MTTTNTTDHILPAMQAINPEAVACWHEDSAAVVPFNDGTLVVYASPDTPGTFDLDWYEGTSYSTGVTDPEPLRSAIDRDAAVTFVQRMTADYATHTVDSDCTWRDMTKTLTELCGVNGDDWRVSFLSDPGGWLAYVGCTWSDEEALDFIAFIED